MSANPGYPLPASDMSHHVDVAGNPAYAHRFKQVGKFHHPGLAPAWGETGWHHIGLDGKPAYSRRFEQVWGYYCLRAAAQYHGRWIHIKPDGTSAYPQNYIWVGNFQEGACVVHSDAGYMHIDEEGVPLYPERYAYVGDYRDGIAVAWVATSRSCHHILKDGRKLNGREYRYLGVFHKGLAKAKDADGWTHIRISGEPAYRRRFKSVEDFYNGIALAETHEGDFIRIDEDGRTLETLASGEVRPGWKILLTGNIGAGKTTLCQALAKATGWAAFGIDDARRIASDGTPRGEALGWAEFLDRAQARSDAILEYTGCGPNSHLVNESLRLSGCRVLKVALELQVTDCVRRITERTWDIPYPFRQLPDAALLQKIHHDLADEWRKRPHLHLSGELHPESNAQTILEKIRLGLH